VIGGPVGDPSTFATLLAAHDNLASKVAVLTQVRNLTAPKDLAPFESLGYRWEDHLNYLIDIRPGPDAILEGMSKARRKGIASGEKAGLAMWPTDKGGLERAYSVLRETHRRAGIPLADKSLFDSALDILAPRDLLMARVAALGGELCAARFVLRWKHTLYDWYAGSTDLGREVHADEWLVWEMLKEGVTKACRTFDFGGAGKPSESYGPREFKRRFGGSELNPGRFVKAYRPVVTRVTRAAYDVWMRWH
jgi:lipid II:glycine glycyltransferase (peptidoglycan interpeptide bridge formation enzyme)